MNHFTFRKQVGKNLIEYLRLKGYTKTSIARKTEIPRPTLNKIFEGNSPNATDYNEQIRKITESLDLPSDYFLNTPKDKKEEWLKTNIKYSEHSPGYERTELAQELLNDLDELLTVAAFYIKGWDIEDIERLKKIARKLYIHLN